MDEQTQEYFATIDKMEKTVAETKDYRVGDALCFRKDGENLIGVIKKVKQDNDHKVFEVRVSKKFGSDMCIYDNILEEDIICGIMAFYIKELLLWSGLYIESEKVEKKLKERDEKNKKEQS